jgi:hypothetical protein
MAVRAVGTMPVMSTGVAPLRLRGGALYRGRCLCDRGQPGERLIRAVGGSLTVKPHNRARPVIRGSRAVDGLAAATVNGRPAACGLESGHQGGQP